MISEFALWTRIRIALGLDLTLRIVSAVSFPANRVNEEVSWGTFGENEHFHLASRFHL